MNQTIKQRSQLVLAAERGLRRESRGLRFVLIVSIAFVAWGVLG